MKIIQASLLTIALGTALDASTQTAQKTVQYTIGDTSFESVIVHGSNPDQALPGILMIPNWMGPTQASLEKAIEIAGDKYVVMMVDMYGVDTRPSNAAEAAAAAGSVRADRELMRARALKALEALRAEADRVSLDTERIAAIGFCFGGGTALEMARAGAEIDAAVSFHGDLMSPTLAADASKTSARLLVLHGAEDPYVPQNDVLKFVETMQGTAVDWQLIQYSGAVHSFTDPDADSQGARYHERSKQRSFAAMEALFKEIWSE